MERIPITWWKSSIFQALQNCNKCHRVLVSNGNSIHQAGIRAKKALALIKASWISPRLGTKQEMLIYRVQGSLGCIRHSQSHIGL